MDLEQAFREVGGMKTMIIGLTDALYEGGGRVMRSLRFQGQSDIG